MDKTKLKWVAKKGTCKGKPETWSEVVTVGIGYSVCTCYIDPDMQVAKHIVRVHNASLRRKVS